MPADHYQLPQDVRRFFELLSQMEATRDPALFARQVQEFKGLLPKSTAKIRRLFGDTPVPINGSRKRGAKLGYFQTRLADGTTGYYMRRSDDCLQAALASLLQVPPHTLPDIRIDARLAAGEDPEQVTRVFWQEMAQWADRRGITLIIHPEPPRSERRWIGVVAQAGLFDNHCLLMHRRDCLFDPFSLRLPSGDVALATDPGGIEYGITIRKE